MALRPYPSRPKAGERYWIKRQGEATRYRIDDERAYRACLDTIREEVEKLAGGVFC